MQSEPLASSPPSKQASVAGLPMFQPAAMTNPNPYQDDDDYDDDEESSQSGPQPILQGTRLEVSKPFEMPDGSWMCIAKLLGNKFNVPWLGMGDRPPPHACDDTQTVFVAQGRGATPELAHKDAVRCIETACRPTSPLVRTRTEAPDASADTSSPRGSRKSPSIALPCRDAHAPAAARPNGKKRGIAAWLKRLLEKSS